MSQYNQNKISQWQIGKCTIYPSLKWNTTYSFEQLTQFTNQLVEKIKLPKNVSITVFPLSSYSSEVNGTWNVSFGIVDATATRTITYMYMIRRDSDPTEYIGGTYGCPFFNSEYCYEKNPHTSLSQKKEYLTIVETSLKDIMGNANTITYFNT